MKLKTVKMILLLAAGVCATPVLHAASSSEMLQQGLYAEEVEGDLQAAIQRYGEVARHQNATRSQAAQALYRLGMCHLKIKDEENARDTLQKLVADYSDQTELVEKARVVLEDLTNFDPAALMPPGTLVYLELGSPGRQIETIVNLLKDTPFENPLALMGGNAGGDSGNAIGGLFNPSMLAEFKKVRSSAIGFAELPVNGKGTSIAVLYPGKSDALRGILVAALSMGGKPAAAIEGMQTVAIQDQFAVAYDDRVMIGTQPPRLLEWCVRQYKGVSREPTLASRNPAFANLTRKQRQDSALTLWIKGDQTYAKVLEMAGAKTPKEILIANSVVDFQHLDTFTLTFGIAADGLNARARLLFNEGHRSLAYDLIRTPNMSAKFFELLPPETVAVAGFALNGGGSIQAAQARAGIEHLTGLDLGRELFANLEQVVVFALPPKDHTGKTFPPDQLGLALTSRNPAQTRELFTRLFNVPGQLATGNGSSEPGKFQIAKSGAKATTLFLEQQDGVTFVAMNQDVIHTVLAAGKRGKSNRGQGSLARVFADLSPSASKLVAANAGALLDFAARQNLPSDLNEARRRELMSNLNQICAAASNATIEIRTDEQPNDFALSVNVRSLPPLNSVLKPISEINRITQEHHMEQLTRERLRDAAVVGWTGTAPEIDGTLDDAWKRAKQYPLGKVVHEQPNGGSDVAADFRTLWDDDSFYVFVDVADDSLRRDNDEQNWYQDDGVEIFIDATNEKAWQHGATTYQYNFRWSPTEPDSRELKHQRLEGVKHAMVRSEKGYRLEVRFPWTTIGRKPGPQTMIGFEVHINDNDSGKRDTILSWHDGEDAAWTRPNVFGNAVLQQKQTAGNDAAAADGSHIHN